MSRWTTSLRCDHVDANGAQCWHAYVGTGDTEREALRDSCVRAEAAGFAVAAHGSAAGDWCPEHVTVERWSPAPFADVLRRPERGRSR